MLQVRSTEQSNKLGQGRTDTQVITKPWGSYKVLHEDVDVKIKLLYVKKGEAISLQYHKLRIERWLILKGSGVVEVGDHYEIVRKGSKMYIPALMVHRITAAEDLTILEVQEGICKEEDIVRLEDKYDRCNS